jgi:ketosteroid isomerase-like protein
MNRAEDEIAITALVNRGSDALNQRDWETYRACWNEDAVWVPSAPVNQRALKL